MTKIAHIMPNYGRYGINGYICIAVGFENFFAKSMKIARAWCKKNGLDAIKL